MSSLSTSPPELDVDLEIEPGRRWIHDAKGPLSVIRGHARLLALGKRGELSDEQRRSVASIEKQVERLESLFERMEAAEPPELPESAFLSGVFPSNSKILLSWHRAC